MPCECEASVRTMESITDENNAFGGGYAGLRGHVTRTGSALVARRPAGARAMMG